MTDMYENYLKKYAYYDNTPSGSGGLTGYDNVKNALAGVAKLDGATVTITEEKKAKTVILTVSFQRRPSGGAIIKRDISATDAMAFLASLKGDRNAVRLRSTNVRRSMTEESVRDAYNAVIYQVALVMGGQDKIPQAEAELQSFIAQQVNEEKHFDSEALTAVAAEFYRDPDTGKATKKSDVTANSRMRTLLAMKTTPTNPGLLAAVKAAGYPVEIVKEAEGYIFVQSKVERDGETEDRYSLRRNPSRAAPSYMDEKTKVQMRLSGDRLHYIDPRAPADKPANKKAEGVAVIHAARGPVARGDDKEYESAFQYLLTQGYTQSVLEHLTHKLVKETAKSKGFQPSA